MPLANTPDDWISLHTRYRTDSTVLEENGNHHSALYLAGYIAECAAKALSLHRNPKPLLVHSLAALLDRAKMPLQGLSPAEFDYVQSREVALRYEMNLPENWSTQTEAARRLAARACGELNRRRKRLRR